jgi:hypothetical protein
MCAGAIWGLSFVGESQAAFDLQFTINSPGSFNAQQTSILNDALAHVENFWENVITGYQPGITVTAVPISINPTFSGLASASFGGTVFEGGFTVASSGFININVNEIVNFSNWQGVPGPPTFKPPTGLNYIDELLAHETGHVLGIGTLWTANNVYLLNTFQYTGQYGTAAYQTEFNQPAMFLPVENAGNPGTPNSHWDQLMRSSPQEGDPNDPWSLDPRVGITDQYGRDRGLELMSGAIDPDYLEPFVSRTTVQSMRDLGYTVTEFEDFNGDGAVNQLDRQILDANFGATGLQIDSMTFGDADRDRDVDGADLLLWQRLFADAGAVALASPNSAGVPEPSCAVLVALAALAALGRRR